MAEPVLWLLGDPPVQVDPATPVVRADDLGMARGESVFETLRVAHGRACFVQAHLTRLAGSAARLCVDLPPGWEELVRRAVASYAHPDGVLRLTCTKGGAAWALLTPVPEVTVEQREHGVAAVTLPLGIAAGLRAEQPWLLGGVKGTSYAVNMAALRAAQALGAQEVVWISSDGFVLEAPTSTVVWVTDGRLVTPDPAEVGTLASTTLEVVAGLVDLDVRGGRVAELRAATEVALLSSVRGVAPVTSLDGAPLPVGPVVRALRAQFEQALLPGAGTGLL